MTSPSTRESHSPAELAERWQSAARDWARWWTGTDLATTERRTTATPTQASSASTDYSQAQALARLNDKYRERWAALWGAATDALAHNPAGARKIPVIAEAPPGDRRFAAPEWNELPFFALMKQSYLLAAEYLNELAASAALPEMEKKRLVFATKQFVDALAPTNFVATNPVVLKRELETEVASLMQGFVLL